MPSTDDKFYRVKIIKRADFSSDLWVIRVQASGKFTFAPGQYATLGVQRTGCALTITWLTSAMFTSFPPAAANSPSYWN